MLRFADISLGQAVDLTEPVAGGRPIAEQLCEMVRRWSGGSDVSIVSLDAPGGDFRPHHVAGRVFARHLDGSRYADVDVEMRRADLCGRAVVRVALG